MLIPVLLLCAGGAGGLDPERPTAEFARRAWQTDSGLPQNTVHSIAQTRDGYVWVATEEGLARFDGLTFKIFDRQNTPALRSNDVRALLAGARTGDLWVCTAAGVARLTPEGEWRTYTVADGLAGDDVASAYEDRAGNVWFATAGGLSRYADERFTSYTKKDGLEGGGVLAVAEDAEGGLWVGTDEGLSRFHAGVFTTETTGDGPTRAVTAIALGGDGCLWLGTASGLSCLREGRPRNFTTADGLPNDRITALRAGAGGEMWVGTAGGLARWGGGRFETFKGEEDGLSGGIILSIFEDAEGSLWVGTESEGLTQLKDRKFTTYTTRDGLGSDLVKSIYEDRAGGVWVGTYGGGLSLLKDGKVKTYTTEQGLASNIVLSLAEGADGALWVGTPDGLSRLRDGRFETYTSAEGLPNDFVRSIYADRAGALWVGTRGGLARLKGDEFETYTTGEGLPDNFVGTIYEDAGGVLWVGTLGGLSRFESGRFKTYTTRDGLSDNVVISVHGDAEGRLWIGTNGGGLNLLKDGRFHSFTTRDGLPNDTIYRVLEDGRGRLWMSCNKGVFRLDKSELEEFAAGRARALNPVVYGTADGMRTRECSGGGHPSAWRDHSGRLWFSTIKGVATIDPEHMPTNLHPPPAAVEQVRVDGEAVAHGVSLPPGKSRFDFYYAGLSFVAPEKVRYRYKLEGFDEDWVDGGDRRVAYYTNLGPGDYNFLVVACNNDGVWSSRPATFRFRLRPHFYRTYWFYALVVVGLGLLGWQLYALRLRQVRERYSAVLQERNRIAREIHDNLAQEILGISVQLEIVARTMASAPDAARKHLDRARALVRSSVAEARRYVWDLRSQSLDERDLPAALSEMTRRLTAESGVQTQFSVGGTFRPLAPQVENNLLRIGQEAVGNAVRHAQATTLSVSLDFGPREVRLEVKDDGRGFDAATYDGGRGGHFGLVGMRERAEQMGGEADIKSEPGGGTQVVVRVPIEA
ncbi:MAG TPA: two-component regulator propeller domain-containing protein [Pyrinomonadaceae bacterium]|nr:two-component regulator propeller domain-containing protein [Pyrinomonadaceae bacterium]